ncbi:cellulose binding domain-containing protein [Actinocrinis puniceicyclus]|uniref:Cellulose binding domain-containing protein n=1 Tax=Actinocrinis puniceicyclus TaxID=977794 RepID=A0A8J7WQ15_9ACTN|nr:cellulose binding domain-containing protein [Actinocrinis puniceicyclus]MBS2963424.1 cellulose binding domain-containing protein [Actinocrinis puniceicyclus]
MFGISGSRFRRVLFVPLLVAVGAVLAVLVRSALPARPVDSTVDMRPAAAGPARIMPLGDSITGSPGCWRALLWNTLQSNGYANIDFVGTQPPQGCAIPYDGDNEGHGGALATNIVSLDELPGWLSATSPDIVLMHLGTNDVWSGLSTQTILNAYSTLVQQMRADNPSMVVLVAQIIPMNPGSCASCAQGVVNLDAAIPAWAASVSTARSPVVVVDQWSGFDDATDTVDGVHPNDSGNQKIASRWYPALIKYLTQTSTPSASASASAAASASPSASPAQSASPSASASASATHGAPGCTATYSITNQWQGGFQGAVTVTAGTSPISGWSVSFRFADGQSVTQSWSAALTQSATAVTADNLSWDGSLAPGTSASFGFLASLSGAANTVPTVTCTPR